MSEFRNQEEVLRALLGGKILISNDNWYKIAEGTVMAKAIDGQDSWWPVLQDFSDYKKYSTYIGPKKMKIITVAPAVFESACEGSYLLSDVLYPSLESAKEDLGEAFCAWLNVEMPIQITVEVDDE